LRCNTSPKAPATIPIGVNRPSSPTGPTKSGKSSKEVTPATKNGYVIEVRELPGSAFYDCRIVDGVLQITVNREHSFAKLFQMSLGTSMRKERSLVETLIVAAARAERREDNERRRTFYRKNRMDWGRHLSELLESK
jgi:hypothetical protein